MNKQQIVQGLISAWTITVVAALLAAVLIVTVGLIRRVLVRPAPGSSIAKVGHSSRDYFDQLRLRLATRNVRGFAMLLFLRPTESVVLLMVLLPAGFLAIAVIAALLEMLKSISE